MVSSKLERRFSKVTKNKWKRLKRDLSKDTLSQIAKLPVTVTALRRRMYGETRQRGTFDLMRCFARLRLFTELKIFHPENGIVATPA